jgi:hypothetical protein
LPPASQTGVCPVAT